MSILHPVIFRTHTKERQPAGARLHRFSSAEFDRIIAAGVFAPADPVELIDGALFIKTDNGPPYDVPLGIPPAVIAGENVPAFPQRRFTVREYHRLLDSGAFHPALRTELVEGWVVEKMTRKARHDSTLQRASEILAKKAGKKWKLRIQMAITMDDGEPEPDIAVVPGPVDRFADAHPRPSDVALVVEVSDTTLAYDRGPKLRDYARNGIARYLILNVVSRQVEEYELPSGPTDQPKYKVRRVHRADESFSLPLDNRRMLRFSVDELIKPV